MQLPSESYLATLPPPNYDNPETRGSAKVTINIVLYTVLICFIGLRIFTRTHLRKFFGADDILILVALIPTSVFFIISLLADTKFHWTRHSIDIPPNEVTRGLKLVLCTEIMFAAACTLTKLSMLFFVWRMLASSTQFWRRITLAAITVVSLQGSVFCLTVIFQCRPPSHYWKVTYEPQPECINQTWSLLVAGIINTLTDFVVVLLPIRTVWSLQLRSRLAIPVILLFAFGFLSCCCGIIRTYFTYKVSTSDDMVWDSYPVWITAALELYIGIICASIPATKPFFSSLLPQIFGTIDPHSRNSKYAYNSQSRQITQSRSVKITSSNLDTEPEAGEELLNLEKGLGSMTTITGGRGANGSDDSDIEREGARDDYLRIRQTVDYVSRRGERS